MEVSSSPRVRNEPMDEGLEVVENDDAPEVSQLHGQQSGILDKSHYPVWTHEKTVNDLNVESTPTHHSREKMIFGLRTTTFWLMVALLVAVVAAIVAGVTASKVHCQNQSSGSQAPQTTATTTTTSISTVTSTLPPVASISSACQQSAGQDWVSSRSQLRYTRVCDTFLDRNVQPYQVIFTSHQEYLDTCISSCDSYNFWSQSQNMTVAVWNWGGSEDETPGTCFCMHVDGEYVLSKSTSHDCALLQGSYNENTIPS